MSDFDGDTEFVEQVARELRAPVVLTPALDERIMEEVRTTPLGGTRRLWLVRPVTLRVSPLVGLLAAAGIAGIAILGASLVGERGRDARTAPPDAVTAAAPADAGGVVPVRSVALAEQQEVQFVFLAPHATNVSLVGEFNDWDTGATPLTQIRGRGVWTITLPLEPGRYLYAFVVDGTEWAPDPAAPLAPDDGFGVPNSVVTVGGPAS